VLINSATPPKFSTPLVLLDDSLNRDGCSLLFKNPVDVIECTDTEKVDDALKMIDQACASGLHAAGFLSYELGYLLEPKLRHLIHDNRQAPLIWMGLFRDPQRLTFQETRSFVDAQAEGDHCVEELQLTLAREKYFDAVARVKAYIAAGDVYQINFTFKYLFEFTGNLWSLYASLRHRQQVAHGAFIQTRDFDVLSLSPELFVRTDGGNATVRPMKGTAARGLTTTEDDALRAWLGSDEKSRAENLMIVDLLRNDLGRIAEIGTVEVSDLFSVETYPTLHQMTSTVTAHIIGDVTASRLIGNLFPCGSITGAPKVRAIEIIRELEAHPRGIYTGAIGTLAPTGDANFNVAIRTLVIGRDGHGEMGIGSGIVHDSDTAAEYEECLLKARFLTEPSGPYALIETMRWQMGEGYYLLENHLTRLDASARHFCMACDIAGIRKALEALVTEFTEDTVRVRLLLDEAGEITLNHVPASVPEPGACLTYEFSDHPVDSRDPYRYHKTTNRDLLDGEHARLTTETGCDEVLFLNENGEVTEGSRSNLFVERDGRLLTPPVSCGLLDGTLRRTLLDAPERDVVEQVLMPRDLETAQRVYLGNSVMGLVEARAHASAKRAVN
jgi:para-aminobenzoate synthetase/4-amino-4-deoxychorismate lyase